ncbi:MAG TPA: acyltransferase family protein [Allosphingosinicella sp.]|nr:acyltransferase family protein [Allosphingosinicella sp.]
MPERPESAIRLGQMESGIVEPNPSPEVPRERLLALDALRGIAAFAVMLIHIGYFSGQRWLAPFGFLAVDLFFMISGFVIGHAFEQRLLAGMPVRRFMAFRLARLYPSLLLGLLLGVAAHLAAPGGDYRLGWHSLGHVLLIPAFLSASIFPLNGVFWSLFFELAINAAHGLAVRRLATRWLAVLVVAAGAAWGAAAWSLGDWGAGWNARTFLAGFARVGWGYGAGLLVYRLFASRLWKLPKVSFLAPLGTAAVLLVAPEMGGPLLRAGASVFLLFPLILLLGVASEVPRALQPAARWLASLSYPLYAVHLPFLLLARDLLGLRAPFAWFLTGLVCLAFASAVASFYDAPMRAWLRAKLSTSTATRAERRDETLTVYSPASAMRRPGAFLAAAWEDLGRSRAVAWRLFRSDLRARRRKSLLGHLWLFVPAAATAMICAYLQARRIVALPDTPIPYPLFVLSGVLLWQTLADAIVSPLQQLRGMHQLITRSRVPHEAVFLAGVAEVLLNGAIRLAVLIVAIPFFGLNLSPALLLLPVAFAALALLGLVVGLVVAPFGRLYEDVGRALPVAILFWFILSPIVYPIPADEGWLRLNPASALVDAGRAGLAGTAGPNGLVTVMTATAIALVVASLFYRLARPHLAARLG